MRRNGFGRTFLGRLARDVRGNTIALAAAAMLPLAGLVGGGVDMSRLYLTKTRLQQACDAGALAGRKAMGAGSWTTGTNSTNAKAEAMFSANFVEGDFGTGALTKAFNENNGVVTGTATATVPMTIMHIFGMTAHTLSVNCTAKMEIPNTDVMFVLDVTGSMNCAPGDTYCYSTAPSGTSKMDGLKSAVKCFYEALERVNTSEVCGNDPTATVADTNAQIRFGFVPYSVNVNVGKLLPNDYLADKWTYQSRDYAWDGTYNSNTTTSAWSTVSGSSSSSSDNQMSSCPSSSYNASDTNSTPVTTSGPDNSIITTYITTRIETGTKYTCNRHGNKYYVMWTTYNNYKTQQTVTTTQTPHYSYTYKPMTFNVSGLKAGGSSWNSSVSLPVGTAGIYTNVTWDGCIEERQTVTNSDGDPSDEWSPIPSAAYDMNIDLIPSSSLSGSQWGPALNGAVWARYNPYSTSYCNRSNGDTTSNVTTSCDLSRNDYYVCPPAASKLKVYNTATDFEAYVNSLSAGGNTYHDIGMLWGARLISPTGIFASENAATPSGRSIQRNIIFMTDGDTNTGTDNYTAYGVGWWDRRQTTYAPSSTNLDDLVNARLLALCSAIKNQNITLWVISFGAGVNSTTESRLSQCASSGHYYAATDNAALMSRFQQIASEISDLRLTS